jgi:hypothetical protein
MARLIGAVMAVLALAAPAAQAADAPKIHVLSNRADLISAGDALVAVDIGSADPSTVRVTVGDRDVTDAFAVRPNGRYEGLVEGLAVGENQLTATVPDAPPAHITIVDHPNGGPVFAGPQVQPWVCQEGARDAQCNQPETYEYEYRSSVTGQFAAYDPDNPPSDVAQTTTDEGVTVPFIVRIETGYQDRDQYKIAVLFDPSKPWTAWAPQRQFNHKLLITHGSSCGIDHQSGSAPSVTDDTLPVGGSPTEALGRGFAIMSTALDNAGHNCNLVTQAESLVMAKERLVERYGELRYTIGTGCSGGSLTQQQVANAYPGIYQGILPQCSFPDAWSTGQQLADYHVYRAFAIRARLEREHGSYANQVIWEGPVPLIGQTDYTVLGLRAMDRWLSAVEKDTRDVPLARKVVDDKPADVHDRCTDGLGHAIPSQEVCALINPISTTPRMVAGEGIETDVNTCSLKPLRRSDYLPIVFTDAQWAQLRAAFGTGVCDWSRPGVDQQATIPWLTYEDTVGWRPLGAPPASSSG